MLHVNIASVMCQEALDMERSYGEEGFEGICRKDKGHDTLKDFKNAKNDNYYFLHQEHFLSSLTG